MIIPFFITHRGCPHHCIFCNQHRIIGQLEADSIASIPQKITKYLNTYAGHAPVHVAFYGGSFTALPIEVQRQYLQAVQPFLQARLVKNIRLSTRPDCVTREILTFLRQYCVQTVELGAQSMNDEVLARAGRGHTQSDTMTAVKLLRDGGFTIGIQLMVGLPGDSENSFLDTILSIVNMKPDFVRLYPTLVIQGTPLEVLYKTGRYEPLSLDEAITLCHKALVQLKGAGIGVSRIGLQPTEELEKPGVIIAGPYHPAFGQLVKSSILLETMRTLLHNRMANTDTAIFCVHRQDLNAIIGQRRSNILALKREFGLRTIQFISNRPNALRGHPLLL